MLEGITARPSGAEYTCPVYEKAWLLYFDILGFRNMVTHSTKNDFGFSYLKSLYDQVIEELKSSQTTIKDIPVEYHWFSDSFMVWNYSDDISSFPWLEFFGRTFLQKCIWHKIPVRGALAFGDFYMEPDGRTFFGPVLVEAHDWAESQNWFNFLLCPSVLEKTKDEFECDERLNYSKKHIPLNPCAPKGEVAAFTYHHHANFEHNALQSLRSMMSLAPKKAKKKYQNTINQINRHYVKLEIP
jgi:hypothetical protein